MEYAKLKTRWCRPGRRQPFLKGVNLNIGEVLVDKYRQKSCRIIRRLKIYCIRLNLLLENQKESGSNIATAAVITLTILLMMTGVVMIMVVIGLMIVMAAIVVVII